MFERFSDRARRVLVLAQEEARLLGHGFIGTEHLLLGLIHEGEGPAAQALESSGISLESVRTKLGELAGSAELGSEGAPPFSPAAKKVLELALREALQLGHNSIGTGHLFLGVLREDEGVATQALRALGADLGRLHEEVVRRLADDPVEGERRTRPGAASGLIAIGARTRRVGGSWRVEVVQAGRGPEDAAAAYRSLEHLVSRFGVELEGLDSSEITVSSIDTDRGPGLLLVVTRDTETGEADEDGGRVPT